MYYGNTLNRPMHDTADGFEQLTVERETVGSRIGVVRVREKVADNRNDADLCRIHDNSSYSAGNVSA